MPSTKTPEFIAISPLSKIPGFEDGDFKISDSSVINEYLDDKYPEIPTRPSSPEDRAKARWLEEYADTKISECGSGLFFERLLKPMFFDAPTDEEKINQIINNEFPGVLKYLNNLLPENGFIFSEVGSVDIAILTHFIAAEYANYSHDSNQYPNLCNYLSRMKSHPILAEMLIEEADILKNMQQWYR